MRLASLLRYATGVAPLDAYQVEHGKVGTPSAVVEDLTAALTAGDRGAHPPGRRHQAPGQDGHRRHLPLRRDAARRCRSCSAVLAAGAPRDGLSYRALRTLVDARPRGRAGHRVHALPHRGRRRRRRRRDDPRRRPAAASRRHAVAHRDATRCSRGTKHRVAAEREVTRRDRVAATAARRDRARGQGQPGDGLTLLHVDFSDRLACRRRAQRVLQGYQGRYAALKDAVTETEPAFDDALLGRPRPRRPAHRAGLRDGRAAGAVRERRRASAPTWSRSHRFRLSRCSGRARSPSGCSATTSEYASSQHDPVQEPRGAAAAKEAVMKALGRRTVDVRAARRRGRPRQSGAPVARAARPGARARRRARRHRVAPCRSRHTGHARRWPCAIAVELRRHAAA